MITDKKQLAEVLMKLTSPIITKSQIAEKCNYDISVVSRALNHPEKSMSSTMIIRFNEMLKEMGMTVEYTKES